MAKAIRKSGKWYFSDTARPLMEGDKVALRCYREGYSMYVHVWRAFQATGVSEVPPNPYPEKTRQHGFYHEGFMDADQDCDLGLIEKVA